MKKLLSLIPILYLIGCASIDHSWVIFDNKSKECTMLYNRRLFIGDRIHWKDINDGSRYTSDDFDIAVVHNERYDLAADQIGIRLEDCHFIP